MPTRRGSSPCTTPIRFHIHVQEIEMKNLLGIFLALMLFALPASAQNRGGKGGGVRGVGGGHVPAHGPAPHPGPAPAARPAPAQSEGAPEQARSYSDMKGHPQAPHVHASGDKWV